MRVPATMDGTVRSSTGEKRVNIGHLPDGQTIIMIGGPGDSPSVAMRSGPEEGFEMGCFSKAGRQRISLGISNDDVPRCSVIDPDGTVIWNAVQPTGEGDSDSKLQLPPGMKIPRAK